MKNSNQSFNKYTFILLLSGFMLTVSNLSFAGTSAYGITDIAGCDIYMADEKKEGEEGKDGEGKGKGKGKDKDGEEPDCE